MLPKPEYMSQYSAPDVVSIIHAVRSPGYESYLPMALYQLSLNPIEKLMTLVSPEDANVPPLPYDLLTNCLTG